MVISKNFGGEFEYGYHVKKEYFDQQMEFENPDLTVFDEMYDTFPNLTTTQIRTILGTFLFSGEDVFKKINVLSGGEKGRLQLCKIFKKGPNLLILDEPTNHMDIIGKESLENILKEYKGTLIFVSHDRYFVNKVADSLLIFEDNKVTYFDGNYEEYTIQKEKKSMQEEKNNNNLKANNKQNDNIKENNSEKKENKKSENSYFLNKEINKIKNKITKLEKEINEEEQQITSIKQEMINDEINTDYVKLKELEDKITDINNNIEEKMNEWENLNNELQIKQNNQS